MRGFARRACVRDAVQWVDQHSQHSERTERVEVAQASGRVLAEDIVSPLDVPPFDRSAMDGYAVRGDETTGATDYNPLVFRVLGEALPGRPFAGRVGPGSAVRIMTGAPMPDGADAVVPAEYAREVGPSVEITQAVPPRRHVGRRGEDVRSGTTVLPAGRRLRPQDVALLAALGQAAVTVRQRPRVRLLITGNELVAPGSERKQAQIYDSNSVMLQALVQRDGGELESVVRVADERDVIEAAMTRSGADVVLVSGGSSVGAEDHAPVVLSQRGQLAVHGVAMRPSSPAGMGRLDDVLVFLLPGNPVSCLCAYDFFAGRAIRRIGGRPAEWPYRASRAVLTRKIASAIGRTDYCRVRLVDANPLPDDASPIESAPVAYDGQRQDWPDAPVRQVEPVAVSGASVLSSTTRADGFLVVPESREGFAPGDHVTVFLYDSV
ncbi:MAG TPA: molybdopterin molybdotransferase MoeA [Planctomycetaceae bacterium]|nr:molybdopterin molybdotransferase MoeA [Planctomycetaceae bacterium]